MVTFTSFIDAAGKNGKIDWAKEAFEEAKKCKLADVVTFNIFIDVLFTQGLIAEAKTIFDEAKFSYVTKIENGIQCIDLHGYSHGAGILAMQKFLEDYPMLSSCLIISGKGLHNLVNYGVLCNKLVDYIYKKFPNWNCIVNDQNEGVVILTRKSGPFDEKDLIMASS